MARVKMHDKPGRPPGAKDKNPRRSPHSIAIMEENGYISMQTAADLVGVHLSTIFRLIRDGVLPSEVVGKFRFVSRQRLAEHFTAPPIRERIMSYVPIHQRESE